MKAENPRAAWLMRHFQDPTGRFSKVLVNARGFYKLMWQGPGPYHILWTDHALDRALERFNLCLDSPQAIGEILFSLSEICVFLQTQEHIEKEGTSTFIKKNSNHTAEKIVVSYDCSYGKELNKLPKRRGMIQILTTYSPKSTEGIKVNWNTASRQNVREIRIGHDYLTHARYKNVPPARGKEGKKWLFRFIVPITYEHKGDMDKVREAMTHIVSEEWVHKSKLKRDEYIDRAYMMYHEDTEEQIGLSLFEAGMEKERIEDVTPFEMSLIDYFHSLPRGVRRRFVVTQNILWRHAGVLVSLEDSFYPPSWVLNQAMAYCTFRACAGAKLELGMKSSTWDKIWNRETVPDLSTVQKILKFCADRDPSRREFYMGAMG
jgi:hypothetical protein